MVIAVVEGWSHGRRSFRSPPLRHRLLPRYSPPMRSEIVVASRQREELIDITEEVRAAVAASGVGDGLCSVYAQGATSAIMVQENWDASIPTDVVSCLRKLIPKGVWLHDRQDGNGDAHLKAGIVGPSETIPIIDGTLGLSRWQNLFFCDFDGPRTGRTAIVTCIADR